MNSQSLRFICIVFSLFFLGCPEERIKPEDKNPLQLTVEDVTCTEAFLKLSFTPSGLTTSGQNRTVSLKRNDSLIATIIMSNNDSLFVDENLLPNKTYTYTLMHDKFSVSAQATTMDTTNSNFTWQTTTFGGNNGSCILYDVAIINDTLAYAVGQIILPDSTGENEIYYNAVKWDGTKWELLQIPFIGSCSAVLYPALRAIWAVDDKNILVTNGGSIVTYDGTNAVMDCRMNSMLTGAINKIYAQNFNDIYVVGDKGTIVHYVNGNWQKIESGTTLPINDIYGDYNDKAKEWEILVVASNVFELPQGKKIIQIKNNTAVAVSDSGLPMSLSGIWFSSHRTYFIVGDGAYKVRRIGERWQNIHYTPKYYSQAIRGKNLNDIVIAGHFGFLQHFNGVAWKDFTTEINMPNSIFNSTDIHHNMIISVGVANAAKALIVMGKRQ